MTTTSGSPKKSAATTATLHKLARAMLGPAGAIFPPHTRDRATRVALAQACYGLSHFVGEHVIACIDHSVEPGEFTGIIVTDRALVTRFGQERGVIPLSQLRKVTLEEGLFSTTFAVETSAGERELPILEDAATIKGFLDAVIDAGYRPTVREAPLVVVDPEADPTGLTHLRQMTDGHDVRVRALLMIIEHGVSEGRLTRDAALDLAVRVALLDKSLLLGRGMFEGAWLSPMRPDDLAFMIPRFYEGLQLHKSKDGQGFTLDVKLTEEEEAEEEVAETGSLQERIQSRIQDKLLGSVVDSVVDRISKKAFGEDLASLLGEEAKAIRVQIAPGPTTDSLTQGEATTISYWEQLKRGLPPQIGNIFGANQRKPTSTLSTFTVKGLVGRTYKPLADVNPNELTRLQAELLGAELRALLIRTTAGWGQPSPEAFATDELELLDKVMPVLSGEQLDALGLG